MAFQAESNESKEKEEKSLSLHLEELRERVLEGEPSGPIASGITPEAREAEPPIANREAAIPVVAVSPLLFAVATGVVLEGFDPRSPRHTRNEEDAAERERAALVVQAVIQGTSAARTADMTADQHPNGN